METIVLKTDLHCKKCINKVEPILKNSTGVEKYQFDLSHPSKTITLSGEGLNVYQIINDMENAGYKTELFENENASKAKNEISMFWLNKKNWKRASFNTLNCLIGCAIGDFGMIIYLQVYHPQVSMATQMILATIMGLITSIILETIILHRRDKFVWGLAFRTALSMSFISMVGMELAMNATDFMITGGKAAITSLYYWLAFIPALVAGFLFPLPYNYYKLQKHGKSCH